MAGPNAQDSGKDIHAFPPSVLNSLRENRSEILAAAQTAGVPPASVAGPIAREMTRREVDYGPGLMAVRDGQSIANALFGNPYFSGPTPYTHQDYVDDMAAVQNGVTRSFPGSQTYHRIMGATDHPVLNDLPPANIRPVAAIDALRYYESHPDQFRGDPFGWDKYRNHYDTFVQDLARVGDPHLQLTLSIQVSAVNAARINQDLQQKVSNWNNLTEDQRSEAITAYSASGGKQFNRRYEENGHVPFELRASDLARTDGASYLIGPSNDSTSNIQRLHDVLGSNERTMQPATQAAAPAGQSASEAAQPQPATPVTKDSSLHDMVNRLTQSAASGDWNGIREVAQAYRDSPQGQNFIAQARELAQQLTQPTDQQQTPPTQQQQQPDQQQTNPGPRLSR